jgi:hypothetical protein
MHHTKRTIRYIIAGLLILLFVFQSCQHVYASDISDISEQGDISEKEYQVNDMDESKDEARVKKRFWLINGTLAGILTAYGFINWWKNPTTKITFTDENWFASYATNGGADKTGHAFSTYIISRTLSSVYRRIGIRDEDADWQGPVVGLSLMTLVEIGDAFSQYSFSTSDLVCDSAGALLAYLEERYPSFDDLVDFRVEYLPTTAFLRSGEIGIDTDYSGMRHLIVLKLSGIERLKNSPLSYLEFHTGYFTRGYSVYDEGYYDKETRHLYAAVSINLSMILEAAARRSDRYRKPLHITSKFLEYYQPPGLYLDYVKTSCCLI